MFSKIFLLITSLSLCMIPAMGIFFSWLTWSFDTAGERYLGIVLDVLGIIAVWPIFELVRAANSFCSPVKITPARREEILRILRWDRAYR